MARSTMSSAPPPQSDALRNGGALESESTTGLLRRLGEDLATLLRKELALASSEISQTVTDAQRGIASVAMGGAVLFAGLIFLLLAATAALAQVVETWLAALIVGGVVAVIGYAMLAAGKRKLKPSALKLERTQQSLREDTELLHRRTQ